MPHTPEILNRLRDALEVAHEAEDHLAAALICHPIDVLVAHMIEPPDQAGSADS